MSDATFLLQKFCLPKGTDPDVTEEQALEFLSQFPKPTAIKNLKTRGAKDSKYDDQTLLHFACRNGWYDVCKVLITKYHCEADAKNKNGETPLYWACVKGRFNIVKYLVSEHHCNPDCKERWYGLTPFLAACSWGYLSIVKYLVTKCGCDPFKTNKYGETPFSLAFIRGRYDVVSFLLTTGKLDKESDVDKIHLENFDGMPQSVISLRRKYPFRPAFKVFVVGNQSAGKSTLVKALENRLTDTSLLGSMTGRFKKVSGVELQTAGIIPTHVNSPKLGHVILYDFAGQYEYYSSHAAYLENLASSPGVLFMLVVDISKSTEDIVRALRYWSSFIANICNQCSRMPQTLVVGSHADVVSSLNEQPSKKLSIAFDMLNSSLFPSLGRSEFVLNCTQAASSSLNLIIGDIIATHSQSFHKQCEVDLQVQILNGVIKQNFEVATKFSNVFQFMLLSQANKEFREFNLLPSDDATLSKHLTTLTEHGQLIYLRNEKDINDSWVILDKEILLSQVNGTIFAPEYFKQHHNISNSTGVVPLSEIKKVFPKHDPQMIASFLTHLEFCHPIEESEASLISGCKITSSVDTSSELYYFFPALVSEERPKESCESIVNVSYKSGWCLGCTRDDQFFTSRFLHVLLLQLAFKFALPPDKTKSCPVIQRKCNIWKSGIHWQNTSGVEAIVEVVEQSTAVTVVIGCHNLGKMGSVRLRSDLIRTILTLKDKFSGAVQVMESVINPSNLNIYPIESLKNISLFDISSIALTISKGDKFVTRKQGFEQQSILINELLYFEPFSTLSFKIITQLLKETDDKNELDSHILNEIAFGEYAHHYVNEFQEVFQVPHHALRDAVCNSPPYVRDDPAHRCYLVFKIWKDQGPRNYGDLRAALDKYSVFCGRNPLVLAGVDLSLEYQVSSQPLRPIHSLAYTTAFRERVTTNYHHSKIGTSASCSDYSDDVTTSVPKISDLDVPTLKELQLLKCRGGRRLRVIESVAADWKYLATSLGIEGPVIRSIEMGAHFQPEEACRHVFVKWLDGGDGLRKPVTWATLIQCLIDAGLVGIAEELEEVLKLKGQL